MIFVTVGTQKFQMNRLIKKVDEISQYYTKDTFFMQIGNADYIPKNVEFERFLSKEKFEHMIESCSMMISHAGVGSIMSGIQLDKKVIVIPRLKKYNEHVDNHQIEIAEAFQSKNCIIYCKELDKLIDVLNTAEEIKINQYVAPQSNIQDMIINYLNQTNERGKNESRNRND